MSERTYSVSFTKERVVLERTWLPETCWSVNETPSGVETWTQHGGEKIDIDIGNTLCRGHQRAPQTHGDVPQLVHVEIYSPMQERSSDHI